MLVAQTQIIMKFNKEIIRINRMNQFVGPITESLRISTLAILKKQLIITQIRINDEEYKEHLIRFTIPEIGLDMIHIKPGHKTVLQLEQQLLTDLDGILIIKRIDEADGVKVSYYHILHGAISFINADSVIRVNKKIWKPLGEC